MMNALKDPPSGASGRSRLFLPLTSGQEQICRKTMAALGDPALRAEALAAGALPAPVLQALRLLDDPEVERAAAGFRTLRGPGPEAEIRERRRTLFRGLRRRHPEAMAAILGAFGAPRGPGTGPVYVVLDVFTWLIIITIGVNGRSDHPFADLDPAE